MPANILRWKGGSGGDMILYFKSFSNPLSVINVKFSSMEKIGKIGIDSLKINQLNLSEVDKIALTTDWVDLARLSDEILQYRNNVNVTWIKSHYYETDQFNDITVDLVVDPVSLPFVVLSNIIKTDTVEVNFNKLSSLISDVAVKTNYSMYSVAYDLINNQKNISDQTLLVSDLLVDLPTFKTAVSNTSLHLDFSFSKVYQDWLISNQTYIPSKQYQKKVVAQDYSFMDTNLSIAERYSLLVLSGNKFINLC